VSRWIRTSSVVLRAKRAVDSERAGMVGAFALDIPAGAFTPQNFCRSLQQRLARCLGRGCYGLWVKPDVLPQDTGANER
jgi:hypothetical protein